MMFHVKQNKKNLLCETKDYLVTGERFKVYLDQNNIIGKTHPVPQIEEMDKYYESEDYYPHSLNNKNLLTFLYKTIRKYMHLKRLTWMRVYLKNNTSILDYGCVLKHATRQLLHIFCFSNLPDWLRNHARKNYS